ncbi:neurocan core protein-like [Saccostrea cucullata]|uniref:neurocan core protein-like n=1 Tax=Saccostrea cuccullata TaxID=36930 RepID=UPI002ED21F0E
MYVQGSGWIYSDIEDWDKELIGPCSKANCNDNQTCQQLPFGEFKCILSDCGVPRSENVTLDAVKRWDGIGIQRRIHIKCAENYKQTGSQQFICQSNGKWRTDLICEKGCDKGWSEFENHCYYKYETSVTWQEAKEKCEKKNAYLVEVNEEKENDFLQKTFLQIIESSACSGDYTCPAWIGANDIDTEGEFIWSKSKENVRFFNWHPNEPNNGVFFNQDCAVLLHTGQWDDGTCSSKIPFICEKEL